jgi:hypothetical protein
MSAKKLHFWIEDDDETFDDSKAIEVDQLGLSDDVQWAAEQFAEWYHDNRDGWEACWPIIFSVGDESGKLLGKVEVDRELRSHFVGRTL